MKSSIQQIESDIAAYKKALNEINMPEKKRLENKYPVVINHKGGVPQSSVDVMIEEILKIDSGYEIK
tara:strand:- start:7306 stop:7506 length:201 start_codon:yes stop_codon:yes gene_type:complete